MWCGRQAAVLFPEVRNFRVWEGFAVQDRTLVVLLSRGYLVPFVGFQSCILAAGGKILLASQCCTIFLTLNPETVRVPSLVLGVCCWLLSLQRSLSACPLAASLQSGVRGGWHWWSLWPHGPGRGGTKLLARVSGSVEKPDDAPVMVLSLIMLFSLLAWAMSDLISSMSSSGCSKVSARPGRCTLCDSKTLQIWTCKVRNAWSRVGVSTALVAMACSASANGSQLSISVPRASPWMSFGRRSWLEVHDW